MKKILNKLNKHKKTFFFFLLGIIVASTTVYGATILYQSNQIGYDNTNSKFKDSNGDDVEDVETALEELYTLLSECEDDYTRENIDGYKYKCVANSVFEVKNITPQVGDLIQMTPALTSYKTDKNMTGYSSTQTIKPSELNLWRVIRVNDDGTYDAVSEYVSSVNVSFGQSGTTEAANTGSTNAYKNYVGYLNVLASKYENSNYTVGSRIIGYNGQTEYISDTSYFDGTSTKAGTEWTASTIGTPAEEYLGRGDELYTTDTNLVKAVYNNSLVAYKMGTDGNPTTTKTIYWLGSRDYFFGSSTNFYFYVRYVSTSGSSISRRAFRDYHSSWSNNRAQYALRPIITLKSELQASGLGTSEYPYVLQ